MKINVFGKGEVYKQMLPLLEAKGMEVNQVLDDFSGLNVEEFFKSDDAEVLFCVGYNHLNQRLQRYYSFKEKGIRFLTLTSEQAMISDLVKIGEGTIIKQAVIIDNYVSIGEACFINMGAVISHDTLIKDGVFLGPGACISGFVTVGEKSFIGTNATIIDHITIGKNSVVAAGAVVIHDVPDNVMVAGNPAVIKKHLLPEKE